MAKTFAAEGKAREVAILAHAQVRMEQTDYDNWNGGTYGYTVFLGLPAHLYAQLTDTQGDIERELLNKATKLTRIYENEIIRAFVIATELVDDEGWRERAKAWVHGKGVSNQGRARSDNVAPLIADGLLFRSQPEIHLYRALKAAGVTFAPLAVFVRGGETYRRIEPDFLILKDGIALVLEVDGDTVHRETPLDAHNRTTMMAHEGVLIERVNANECDNPEKAKQCAAKILALISKHKANK
jgi:hypothetical protein